MPIPIYQVDAFTDTPFCGNPAAVCLLDQEMPAAWMQAVAAEMNLSETAFLLREEDGYSLRWFTPAAEVELCGHATLASAHTLWETGLLAPNRQARFHTLSGLLTATRSGERIELDFPATPVEPSEVPAELTEAIGLEPVFAGKTRWDYFLEAADEGVLRSLRPDFGRLARVPARGVIVTAKADGSDHDFLSRFFAPQVGVPEDPVTGSAHSALTPYWAARLGKTTLRAYQASRRGGELWLRLAGDRVLIAGQAVTVLAGKLADGTPAA